MIIPHLTYHNWFVQVYSCVGCVFKVNFVKVFQGTILFQITGRNGIFDSGTNFIRSNLIFLYFLFQI